jgi:hypothetical protein
MATSAYGMDDSMIAGIVSAKPPDMVMNVPPSMGDRFMLQIDRDWIAKFGYSSDANAKVGWTSPLGTKLCITYYNFEDGIVESGGVNYSDADVIGRGEQIKTYVGTANREIPLTFQFQAQGSGNMDLADSLKNEVLYPAKWLDALKHPYIDEVSGLSHPPPPVLITIGSLICARCIATDVQITWKPPFHPVALLPYAAEVTCTFTVVRNAVTNYNHKTNAR